MIDVFHGFFFFLGQPAGELFKTFIELVLFSIVNYMVISEWTRHKRGELRFLIIAFSVMMFQKLVTVFFLSRTVFIGTTTRFVWLTFFDNIFEVFAIFLVANAFVYPILKQKKEDTVLFIRNKSILLIGVGFVFSIFVLSIIDLNGGPLDTFWSNTSINVMEIVILLYYAAYLMVSTKQKVRYRANIILSFIIYTITPTIELFNIILYDNMNQSLTVASHPFPFLSVLIMTQVIYLKLVDKAVIITKLRESQQKYLHEKEVSRLKDDFISTVSHELRTPLTSMKLYVSLLKNKKLGRVSKKQEHALEIINEETNRLNKLIADILDLSRLEAHKAKLNAITFDLYEVVSNELYLNMAKEKGISVVLNVPRRFMVTADKDKIKQVFINLYTNAIKFTPSGGTITLTSRLLKSDWEFSISDTGRGVKKELLPKLFNKFYQVDNIMTRSEGGTGLGLAIVKNIIELHKGKIHVESEEGKGTKITMRIPRELEY